MGGERDDRIQSRPPHGGRGLKGAACAGRGGFRLSPPSRGAWIESKRWIIGPGGMNRRPPHGGRGLKDIEIAEILIASFSVLWYDAGEEGIKSGKTKDKNRCR